MTTGVLLFAFNNQHVNYLAMAAWSAKNIQRHLGLPVSVVTDRPQACDSVLFDQIIHVPLPDHTDERYFKDYKKTAVWHNTTRVNAYELSPYDQTLVLDVDYVVASDQLALLCDTLPDFLAHNRAHDLSGHRDFNDNNWFGLYRMPMTWATVMFFRRSPQAQHIFSAMQLIRNHWQHYRQLYHIGESTYRNDYALSIAQNLVNGHVLQCPHIPWSLATVTAESQLTQIDTDTYMITYASNNEHSKWLHIKQDFHAMGKYDLEQIIAHNS